MRLERIELYQLHAVDHRIPIEDSVGALVDLQRDGKIHQVGVSNVSERELARARSVANIVSVQNCYNLRDRSSDGLIDSWAGAGIAFIPGRMPTQDAARCAKTNGKIRGLGELLRLPLYRHIVLVAALILSSRAMHA